MKKNLGSNSGSKLGLEIELNKAKNELNELKLAMARGRDSLTSFVKNAIDVGEAIEPSQTLWEIDSNCKFIVNKFITLDDPKFVDLAMSAMKLQQENLKIQLAYAKTMQEVTRNSMETIILSALRETAPELLIKIKEQIQYEKMKFLQKGLKMENVGLTNESEEE